MNSSIIDLIFAVFFVFMAILGYIKGFVTRLYDLIGTIFVVFLSYLLASPIALVFKIYQYDETDIIAAMIGKVINQILIFILLFVGLMIIKKIIGLFIKPVLKKMTHFFHLTKWADQGLGSILGMIEAVFISYMILVFVFIPFFHGNTVVEETLLAKHVLRIVPSVSEQVIEFSKEMENPRDFSLQTLTKCILFADSLDLIDKQQATQIFEEKIQKQLQDKNISLSVKEKQQIKQILEETHYSSEQIETILSKINVSGE